MTAVVAALLPAWASGAPALRTLSAESESPGYPEVAVNFAGEFAVVWAAPSTEAEAEKEVIEARVGSLPTRRLGPRVTLGDGTVPQVAIDPAGDVSVVWPQAETAIVSRSELHGGAWQPPRSFAGHPLNGLVAPLAMNYAGDALAGWAETVGDGLNHRIRVADLEPGGSVWQLPFTLSAEDSEAYGPEVAVNARGDAVAVWERWPVPPLVGGEPGTPSLIEAAVGPAGQTWSAPVVLSHLGGRAFAPSVSIDSKGRATVVWARGRHVEFASTRRSDSWSPPRTLSSSALSVALLPEVAVDRRGDTFAAWFTKDTVEAALRRVGHGWSKPSVLSCARSGVGSPVLEVDPRGDALVVWQSHAGVAAVVRRGGASAWSRPFVLARSDGSPDYEPQAGIDAAGVGLVTWSQRHGGRKVVDAGVIDTRAPGDPVCR